ncbi:MAG: GNAT family N-acetyltransferase [Chloroflexales bacterium]|nr:GNAT family N-acetyltransferase [Chloroflexales bacterium]
MHIRPATPADSAALADIQIASYRTAYAPIMPATYLAQFSHAEQTADWRELLSQPGADRLLVAEDVQAQVLGYALGRLGPIAPWGYGGELVALHVRLAAQRRGVGSHLFAHMVDLLGAEGAGSLMLWTLARNPVRAWYERLGGQLRDEQQLDIDGHAVCEVAFGWLALEPLQVLFRAAEGPRPR